MTTGLLESIERGAAASAAAATSGEAFALTETARLQADAASDARSHGESADSLAQAEGAARDGLGQPSEGTEGSSDHAGRMLSGALWAIGGTLVTAWTYSAAQDGGVYVVAWGAIVFGAIDFFRGLVGVMAK